MFGVLQRSKQKIDGKIVNIFLSVGYNICFGCSKEPSHRDGSFEYQQHMFWLRNEKIVFNYTFISKGLVWKRTIS